MALFGELLLHLQAIGAGAALLAIMAQKLFSLRLPWCGNCHDSTGRRLTGSPVASLKARS